MRESSPVLRFPVDAILYNKSKYDHKANKINDHTFTTLCQVRGSGRNARFADTNGSHVFAIGRVTLDAKLDGIDLERRNWFTKCSRSPSDLCFQFSVQFHGDEHDYDHPDGSPDFRRP